VASAQATLGERVFVYLFTQETDVFGGILGSCHALELPYVFGTIREEAINVFAGGGPASGALSEEMMRAWTSFARTGQPETPATWAPFETRVKATRVFGPNGGLRDHPRADELEAVASAHVRKFPATGA
jgi:para-nitrobenzyl esterase